MVFGSCTTDSVLSSVFREEVLYLFKVPKFVSEVWLFLKGGQTTIRICTDHQYSQSAICLLQFTKSMASGPGCVECRGTQLQL